MNVHESTIEKLNEVLEHHQQMQKAVKTIRSMQYKKIGLIQVAVTDEDRKLMIATVRKKGTAQCSGVYEEINQARQKAGLPGIPNPYKN